MVAAIRSIKAVRSLQGDTADTIIARHYGPDADMLQELHDANPGLAALGPILPTGTIIRLPPATAPKTKATATLWD